MSQLTLTRQANQVTRLQQKIEAVSIHVCGAYSNTKLSCRCVCCHFILHGVCRISGKSMHVNVNTAMQYISRHDFGKLVADKGLRGEPAHTYHCLDPAQNVSGLHVTQQARYF